MSLKIASAFISALRSNDELLTILGGKGDKKEGARIFTVARPQCRNTLSMRCRMSIVFRV